MGSFRYNGGMSTLAITTATHAIFCANLRRIRIAKGIGQKELAGRAGISQPAYSCLERGENEPVLSTIETVALALGVTPKDLLDADAAHLEKSIAS